MSEINKPVNRDLTLVCLRIYLLLLIQLTHINTFLGSQLGGMTVVKTALLPINYTNGKIYTLYNQTDIQILFLLANSDTQIHQASGSGLHVIM